MPDRDTPARAPDGETAARVPVLLVTGSLGSGKTAVVGEITDILSEREIAHAAVDFDWLCQYWPADSPYGSTMGFRNLAAVWREFSSKGIDRLVVARVIEHPDELSNYARAVPGAELTVCRILASLETMRARLRAREHGRSLPFHLRRTEELDEFMDRAAVEHFAVENENRAIGEVAEEVLARAGWLEGRK